MSGIGRAEVESGCLAGVCCCAPGLPRPRDPLLIGAAALRQGKTGGMLAVQGVMKSNSPLSRMALTVKNIFYSLNLNGNLNVSIIPFPMLKLP